MKKSLIKTFSFLALALAISCGDDEDTESRSTAFATLAAAVDCSNALVFDECTSSEGARCINTSCSAQLDNACTNDFCPIAALDCAADCDNTSCQDACFDSLSAAGISAYNTLASCAQQNGCIDVDARVN